MSKLETKQGWEPFLKLCRSTGSKEQLNDLFELMFTFEERKDIATRYLIVKSLLQETLTQREMAEELKVSIAKITRGSNSLKIIDNDLREFLEDFIRGTHNV